MKTLGMIVVGLAFAQASCLAQIAISSPSFQAGGAIPAQFTCNGANQNPPLQFRGVPKEAKSLVLIVDDPDAPGGLFTHWLVWNIDPTTSQLGGNSVPADAAQGTNDFGRVGYGGPCPPAGTHRYYFRLFAIDQKIDLNPGAKRSALDRALKGHVLARGELMGRSSH
jgi:Raf kinase inhibitor-like YbhB/YbcL family protein